MDKQDSALDMMAAASDGDGGGNPEDSEATSDVPSAASQKQLRRNQNVLQIADSSYSALPTHINELLLKCSSVRQTKHDILIKIIYALALECGFVPASDEPLCPAKVKLLWSYSFDIGLVERYIDEMPEPCYNMGSMSYTLRLSLLGFSEKPCLLVATEVSDSLCCTFSVDDSSSSCMGKSIFVPTSRYIINTSLRKPSTCLQNLAELSMKMKENLFFPIRNQLMITNQTPFAGLLGIPEELRWCFYKRLKLVDLQNLSHACTLLRDEVLLFLDKNNVKFSSERKKARVNYFRCNN